MTACSLPSWSASSSSAWRAAELMAQGVTLLDPARLDVRGEVSVGRDVLIDVNVVLEGQVVIEDDVQIGPNCLIKDSTLRRGAVIKANTHLEGAELGPDSDAGPFARLRPGSVLGARAHVGNFVELKNARLGEGGKVGHLSYLGDGEVGARSNIGAGTITCNYDGANKWRTEHGRGCFHRLQQLAGGACGYRHRGHDWRGFHHYRRSPGRHPGRRSRQAAGDRRLEAPGKDQEILIHNASSCG